MKKLLILALLSFSVKAEIGFKETTYERYDDDEATITITNEGGGYLTVKGDAIWVNPFGVAHTGMLDNTVKVKKGIAFYRYDLCKLTLKFENRELVVSGDNDRYCGGLNVQFNGHYIITNQDGIYYSIDN